MTDVLGAGALSTTGRSLYIYGCGGHGRVILDSLPPARRSLAHWVADAPTQTHCLGRPVHSAASLLAELNPASCEWIVAIGNNALRQKVAQSLEALGHSFATVIHPTAHLGSRVTLGAGTVILARAVVNCDSRLGQHVIVNTGSLVDHDCIVGDFCHLAPGSVLAGHVEVGEGCWLQVGTLVAPGVAIAAHTTTPPGAVYP